MQSKTRQHNELELGTDQMPVWTEQITNGVIKLMNKGQFLKVIRNSLFLEESSSFINIHNTDMDENEKLPLTKKFLL